jgi:hypothetical protein
LIEHDPNEKKKTPVHIDIQENAMTWSPHDVGQWLQHQDLEKYRAAFEHNQISGKELLDLTVEDMVALGINALGHRKRLLARISELHHTSVSSDSDSDSDIADPSLDSSKQMPIKCYYKKSVALVSVTPHDASIAAVKARLLNKFNCDCSLSYTDQHGATVKLSKDSDLRHALLHDPSPLTVQCKKRSTAKTIRV